MCRRGPVGQVEWVGCSGRALGGWVAKGAGRDGEECEGVDTEKVRLHIFRSCWCWCGAGCWIMITEHDLTETKPKTGGRRRARGVRGGTTRAAPLRCRPCHARCVCAPVCGRRGALRFWGCAAPRISRQASQSVILPAAPRPRRACPTLPLSGRHDAAHFPRPNFVSASDSFFIALLPCRGTCCECGVPFGKPVASPAEHPAAVAPPQFVTTSQYAQLG